MNKEIIENLRHELEQRLLPLINSDYIFVDLPYYPNVGDTLIAFAEEKFLSSTPYRCLYWCSEYTFDGRPISSDVLIIFHGGGSFGDLWKSASKFRNKVILDHPDNHFLILPQSVCYCDDKNMEEDVELFSRYGNRITISARDINSYELLRKYFVSNNVLLVPDMAFYLGSGFLKSKFGNDRILFLRRSDKEFVPSSKYDIVPENAEIHDWPTIERFMHLHWKYLRFKRYTRGINWYPKAFLHLEDFIWRKVILPYFLRSGINFVNQYDVIYSTRLHVAILGVLLDKQVYLFDNSYGKNSSLFNTWLKDYPSIKLV